MVVKYTQSLATIQKDGATEVHETFSSPFGHLHESFLDSSDGKSSSSGGQSSSEDHTSCTVSVGASRSRKRIFKVGPIMERGRGEEKFEICVYIHTYIYIYIYIYIPKAR